MVQLRALPSWRGAICAAVVCVMVSAGPGRAGEEDGAASPPFTNSLGMRMMPIASGSFVRGSDEGTWDERPVHAVTISRPFYVSETEVTNA